MPRTRNLWVTKCSIHCRTVCYRLANVNNTNINIYVPCIHNAKHNAVNTYVSESLVSLKVLIQNERTWWFMDQNLRNVFVLWELDTLLPFLYYINSWYYTDLFSNVIIMIIHYSKLFTGMLTTVFMCIYIHISLPCYNYQQTNYFQLLSSLGNLKQKYRSISTCVNKLMRD